jgi:hypothetical protein
MKWKNKGREFDECASSISEKFKKNIYVFGTGQVGERLGYSLMNFGMLGGFIDNSIKKQGREFLGMEVLSLDEYLEGTNEKAIVIATTYKNNSNEIENQLICAGLHRGQDYYLTDEFVSKVLPILAVYEYNKTFMWLAQIVLTERCSLKCKKCAHACAYVDYSSKDMPLEEVYKSADCFFKKIDFIGEFVLIGGEPLLYRELANAIEYIGKHYRKQMGNFCITTNGTIIPGEEVLIACKNNCVKFEISNYSKTLPWIKERQDKLIKELNKYGIAYVLASEDGNWIDYGFDEVNNKIDEDYLIDIFDACHTPCREVRGSKLFYCVMARSVSDNMGFGENEEDYLDLEKMSEDNYKKELIEYNYGYSEKGYLKMCHRCRGKNAEKFPIPVAEQLIDENT